MSNLIWNIKQVTPAVLAIALGGLLGFGTIHVLNTIPEIMEKGITCEIK